MDLKGCLGRLFFGPCMHIVVAEEPGILLTNSPGWDFMSEIGLARAGSNEASTQNNKSNPLCFIVSTKNVIFSDLTHWLMTHWLIENHKTSVLLSIHQLCGRCFRVAVHEQRSKLVINKISKKLHSSDLLGSIWKEIFNIRKTCPTFAPLLTCVAYSAPCAPSVSQ